MTGFETGALQAWPRGAGGPRHPMTAPPPPAPPPAAGGGRGAAPQTPPPGKPPRTGAPPPECRIYAEDPDQNFMPTIGKIQSVGVPTLRDVRLDCGFLDGSEVGVNYDPMLAKLVVWGENREVTLLKTLYSLDEVLFLGVKTNRDYLKRILKTEDFVKGVTHTHFIADHSEELEPTQYSDQHLADLIAAYNFGIEFKSSSHNVHHKTGQDNTPWTTLTGFRVNLK